MCMSPRVVQKLQVCLTGACRGAKCGGVIRAIETHYNGYIFRSRMEARWAVYWDALGIRYEYEKEGFDFGDGMRYLPDFWLPDAPCMYARPATDADSNICGIVNGVRYVWVHTRGAWVEIKGILDTESLEKARRLREATKRTVYVVCTPPGSQPMGVMYRASHMHMPFDKRVRGTDPEEMLSVHDFYGATTSAAIGSTVRPHNRAVQASRAERFGT